MIEPKIVVFGASNPSPMRGSWIPVLLVALLGAGCARDEPASPVTSRPVPAHARAADRRAAISTSAAPSRPTPPAASSRRPPSAHGPDQAGTPCGALGCELYATPEAAFSAVLESRPRVLGVGEAHAQKGTEQVPSATVRFREALLPMLRGRATDLVLELWVGRSDCVQRQRQVAREQKPVTAPQAKTNQNEFVELAKRAKALGIAPHVLRPTCADYDDIVRAGDDSVAVMLEKIAEMTTRDVETLLRRHRTGDALVVTYGGALHNDIAPRPGRETMSFGPELDRATHGRYVELDLIVPEYIKDTDVWRSLDWYPKYDGERFGARTVLFEPRPRSYVLIFPRQAAKAVK